MNRSKAKLVRASSLPLLDVLEDRRLFSGGYSYNVVAAFGQALPRASDGVYTGDFEPGGVNNRGQIVYTSDQGKPDRAHDQGQAVFLTSPNGAKPIKTLLLSNAPAPGGGTFGGFGSLSPDAINDVGDAAFAFTLTGQNVPLYHAGVYRYDHTTGHVTAVLAPGVTRTTDGTLLRGTSFAPSINHRGDVSFVGVIATSKGAAPATGLGEGLFVARHDGVHKLVAPGDPAPGGTTFDAVTLTSINDFGAVAFGGHLAADPRLGDDGTGLGAFQGVFVRRTDGSIEAVARQGTAIPASAGGAWYDVAFDPVINNRGQVAFTAAISPTKPTGDPATDDPSADPDGVFLYTNGRTIAVARPGQLMPGGAHLVRTSFQPQGHLNNRGEVTYNALLDDGTQGVFVWSNGVTYQVARTGTTVPGAGRIASFDVFNLGYPNTFATNNDKGQVAFGAVLTDGREALVLATPHGSPTVAPVQATPPAVFAPGSLVRGKTVGQWVAAWWTKLLQTKVHTAGGGFLNPNFDTTGAQTTAQGNTGKVFYLFGSFAPGAVHRTATVPSSEPIFIPVLPNEFSNADTADADGTIPGHYTAAQLADLSAQSALSALQQPGGEIHVLVDGQPVADLGTHREASGVFHYTLPATDNVGQNFGGTVSGPVSPAVADGFYVMLQPLTPGRHVVSFGGTTPPNNPLGAFSIQVTYDLHVV